MKRLPLVGLVDDGILPGETRRLPEAIFEDVAIEGLPALVSQYVVVVAYTHLPEHAPNLRARYGTLCKVLAADAEWVRLLGVRRVHVTEAIVENPLDFADIEGPKPRAQPARPTVLIAAARAVFEALDRGAIPPVPNWEKALEAALVKVASALQDPAAKNAAMSEPFDLVLQKLAQVLSTNQAGEEASAKLEEMLDEAKNKPMSPALRERLWGQLVELQRRLDIEDPAAPEPDTDAARLTKRLAQAGLPKEARALADRQLGLLANMATNHHDYAHTVTQLDLIARLSWHPDPLPPIDLAAVERALDAGHAGLDTAKKRVLEHLAVRKIGGSKTSMVLCLAGPPGVGKTSIARSIADALGRKLVRVPLGGVHDECEIRGHRLSFTAAQPGRIIGGLALIGSSVPVILLDEIDKLGADRSRTPGNALLEVLDPEQNTHFQDNYLTVPFDLSQVLFIATANDVTKIDPILRDRLEIVEIDGYTLAEKLRITRDHLLAKLAKEHGLGEPLAVEGDTLGHIIESYTAEAGVRQLHQTLAAFHRARAVAIAKGSPPSIACRPIEQGEVRPILGPPRFFIDTADAELAAGVATALSVGPAGGAILFVEVGTTPGRGDLHVTGSIGSVMQESAEAALAYLRINARQLGLEEGALARDVHVHVPAAATQKDGPSAGIAIAAAMLSAMSGVPLRAGVAMTGELTLSGRLLPVGGVRAKLLAAERAGTTRVIVPDKNRADVPEGLDVEVIFADTVDAALTIVRGAPSFAAGAPGGASPAAPA